MELDQERLRLDAQERLAMLHLEEAKLQTQVDLARAQSAPQPHIEARPAGRLN